MASSNPGGGSSLWGDQEISGPTFEEALDEADDGVKAWIIVLIVIGVLILIGVISCIICCVCGCAMLTRKAVVESRDSNEGGEHEKKAKV